MQALEKSKTPILYTQNIERIFKSGHEKIHALNDVTVKVHPGEITLLLVGRSGSGKTTLLNILSSMDKPDAGSKCFFKSRK